MRRKVVISNRPMVACGMDAMISPSKRLAALPMLVLAGCGVDSSPVDSSLRETMTFYASFDDGPDAEFARGDATLYAQSATESGKRGAPGLPEEARIAVAGGEFGNCLSFATPRGISGTRAFFKLKDNFPYRPGNWGGAVSFWMRLSPKEDLRPGFTDPIQLTSKSALDGGIWVDFDRAESRQFRMGAFPDKALWNPENRRRSEIPNAEKPLVPEKRPSFARERWTHVLVAIDGFNNEDKNGSAVLYLDG